MGSTRHGADAEAVAPATSGAESSAARLPAWLKVKLPGDGAYYDVRKRMRDQKLHTVCEEARCPNVAECWGVGTATFMILGKVCTRACRFCEVTSGKPPALPDPDEPQRLARAVAAMKLRYAVITSVDRDDLADGGAAHFVATVEAIKALSGETTVEILTPDFAGNQAAIDRVAVSGAEVLAQNLETVERLTRELRDVRSGYQTTLDVLARYRHSAPHAVTKSSLLLGVGERTAEVEQALRDLRSVDVDWVTLGQYLRPTRKHAPVHSYLAPEQFAAYAELAKSLGFALVSSGPLVRSSYRAAEHQAQHLVAERRAALSLRDRGAS